MPVHGGEGKLDPGASPDSKHPPLIKNPFFLVTVKSKSIFVVASSKRLKLVDLDLTTALSTTYLIIGFFTL